MEAKRKCVYDNPVTLRREWWKDGEIQGHLDIEAFADAGDSRGCRIRLRPFKDGAVVGDPEAMVSA